MTARGRAARWVVMGFFCWTCLMPGFAADVARLDPALVAWLGTDGTARGSAPESVQMVASPTGEVRLKVLATLSGRVVGSLGGVPIGYQAGPVATLSVTRDELASVLADERVAYVEPSWRTRPALDVSVEATRADDAHAALPPIRGKGILVGVVDTGVDFRHLDFRHDADRDDSEETSRIVALWDQTWGLFGATYDQDDLEADLASGDAPGTGIVKQVDRDGHGTHVASIAVGDGSSSTGGFVGIAPEASIVVVKTTFFTADILEAVSFIFEEAERRGMPAVVNLSLGGHEGPHDGTSAFERGLEELAQGPGRAVVVSAGNEGDLPIHISGTLQGGSKAFELEAGAREVTMELWYPGSSRFSVTMTSPSGATVIAAPGAGSGFVPTSDGIAYIDNASGGANPNNGDREVFVRITNTNAGTRWRVVVRDESGGGRFDGWITTSTGKLIGGDSELTIDEPGNSRGVITVGAFNTKAVWPSEIGEQDDTDEVEVGSLSGYSSQGPTRDGRNKPDLAAPGTWICAALSGSAVAYSDQIHPDGVHVVHRGTSMAAPHVTGTIALLFAVEPTAHPAEVLLILTDTARRDSATGAAVGPRWGSGKLDVWAALVKAGEGKPPAPSAVRPKLALGSNPAVGRASFAYELPAGTLTAWLRIYDIEGRRVFEVPLSVSAANYIWNLVSMTGDLVSPGLYLCVVASDRGNSAVERLVVAP